MIKFKALLTTLTLFIIANEDIISQNIEGNWTMCVKGYDGHTIHANICTDIFFSEDGTGIIEYPGKRSSFQWKIRNKKIIFLFKSKEDEKNFISSNKKLRFKIYQEKELEYFKLVDIHNNSWYLLSRNIK